MKTIGRRFRAALLMAAAVSVLAFAAGVKAQDRDADHDSHSDDHKSPVLAVVGDISCQPGTEAVGESSKETCTDPKSPYSGTNSTPKADTAPQFLPYALWQSQEATANQIEKMKPNAVALLGDLQYQVGRYSDFEQSFDLTYGAFKKILRPAPGNHEFYDEHGERGVAGYGYFSYFNGFQIDILDANAGTPLTTALTDPCPSGLTWTEPNAPDPLPVPYPASPCGYSSTNSAPVAQPIPRSDGQAGHFEQSGGLGETVPSGGPVGVGDGWYSYNLGSWHLISLNIECSTQPGGCNDTAGSWLDSELQWLKKDLDENHAACTAAYWHQPTFSATNGLTQEGATAQLFWQLLYEHKADLVLNGHDHLYARYKLLDPSGKPDRERGIREFIVGTGGETLDPIALAAVSSTQATSASAETNQEDPSGNIDFNQKNLEAYTGDYWGVMALTLDPNGYHWDYESALAGPSTLANGPTSPSPNSTGGYSDSGFGTCHGSDNRW